VTVKYAEEVDSLDIARPVIDAIVAHARREAPSECCGLLVGQGTVVERAVATSNESDAPRRRYLIAPRDLFNLIRELRGSNRQIVGAYHSHVHTDAVPSPTDLAEAWPPPFVYVIVSLKDAARPDLRAFVIDEGKPLPLEIATSPP
jgi:proteasome lid subunit RPN8/RPN11